MRLTDAQLQQFHEQGFVVVPGFLGAEKLARAQDALSLHLPSPEAYFADPGAHSNLSQGQFVGLTEFPFKSFDLNRLAVDEDLIAISQHLMDAPSVRLSKAELWGKYAGAVDYDQELHRDYGNHTLVVPRADGRWRELTTFIYLSDVTEQCGPTAIVPRPASADVPLGKFRPERDLSRFEKLAVGPAGSLVLYSFDVFHRGTQITGEKASRFMLLFDYRCDDMTWGGKHSWPSKGIDSNMHEFLQRVTPEQRTLLDFPPPGHPYWNDQTLLDTQLRYPDMDLAVYRAHLAKSV